MHWIVPFASGLSEALSGARAEVALPRLAQWAALARREPVPGAEPPPGMPAHPQDPELSLSPPHEVAWARAIGWQPVDGCVPLAAVAAARAGLLPGGVAAGSAWGRLTPAHWQIGTEQVTLLDPAHLGLDEAESRAFLEAVRPLLEEGGEQEGATLHWAGVHEWLLCDEGLAGLACASRDRVIGRHVDLWLGADPRARRVRRLQNEVQMLLHTHPLNAEREARGALPLNSFWLDGCGALPGPWVEPQAMVVDARLRGPALADDGSAWARAFEALDEEVGGAALSMALEGHPTAITLCGERHACTLRAGPVGPWPRWRMRLAPPGPAALRTLLEGL